MENKEIVERVKGMIGPYLDGKGIELIEITYRRESNGMTLRLLVDTPSGIHMDECEKVNNYLSDLLDNEDVINERYLIEVSSPGLDRPIKTDKDFERSMGRELEVTTYVPIDDRKIHEGVLIGMAKDKIVLEADNISTEIPRDKVAVARLKIRF